MFLELQRVTIHRFLKLSQLTGLLSLCFLCLHCQSVLGRLQNRNIRCSFFETRDGHVLFLDFQCDTVHRFLKLSQLTGLLSVCLSYLVQSTLISVRLFFHDDISDIFFSVLDCENRTLVSRSSSSVTFALRLTFFINIIGQHSHHSDRHCPQILFSNHTVCVSRCTTGQRAIDTQTFCVSRCPIGQRVIDTQTFCVSRCTTGQRVIDTQTFCVSRCTTGQRVIDTQTFCVSRCMIHRPSVCPGVRLVRKQLIHRRSVCPGVRLVRERLIHRRSEQHWSAEICKRTETKNHAYVQYASLLIWPGTESIDKVFYYMALSKRSVNDFLVLPSFSVQLLIGSSQ